MNPEVRVLYSMMLQSLSTEYIALLYLRIIIITIINELFIYDNYYNLPVRFQVGQDILWNPGEVGRCVKPYPTSWVLPYMSSLNT